MSANWSPELLVFLDAVRNSKVSGIPIIFVRSISPGSVSFILAYDRGETILTFYDEVGQIETLTIPWQEVTPGRLDEDSQRYLEQPWLDSGEAYSVLIAARKAVEMLEKLDEDPGNAWFAMADWIKEYE